MNDKSRKILSRVGAGLLLGMSLFNFGIIWGKQNVERIPRKARNVREQIAETDMELQAIADIAEKEAQIVMAQEQLNAAENQRQSQEEDAIVSPRFFRYVAIALWVFSASVLFSSTIFNYPFIVGKGALALLPGVPHVAKISLTVPANQHKVGERVDVLANLDTNGYEVDFVRMTLNYDPEMLSFEGYDLDRTKFDAVEERIIDHKSGKVTLSLKNKKGGVVVKNKKFMKVYFKAIQTGRENKISISKEESAVVRTDNEKNILGKTKETAVVIFE